MPVCILKIDFQRVAFDQVFDTGFRQVFDTGLLKHVMWSLLLINTHKTAGADTDLIRHSCKKTSKVRQKKQLLVILPGSCKGACENLGSTNQQVNSAYLSITIYKRNFTNFLKASRAIAQMA